MNNHTNRNTPHEMAQGKRKMASDNVMMPELDYEDVRQEHAVRRSTPPQEKVNPLLERARIPGETFKLPSGGKFYTDELDESVKNGEILIFPMTTIDEIVIKTPDKLLNGTAITEVFKRCIPQVLKPLDLWAKDVDYIMVCLRKITYGDSYEVSYKHNCENAKEHSYIIDLEPILSNAKRIQTKAKHKLTLPNQQVLHLLPPRYFSVLQFFQAMGDEKEDPNKISDRLLASIVEVIDEVDGIKDNQMIYEWIKEIPAGYVAQISDKVAEVSSWGPSTEVELTCKDCGEFLKRQISLNPIDFFS